MKKSKFLVVIMFFYFLGFIHAQNKQNKIVVAQYSLFPYSEEYLSVGAENSTQKNKDFNLALRKTLEFKYTLLLNESTKQSVFYLDSLVTRKVKGKEDFWIEAESKMPYAFKKGDYFYAKEEVFGKEVYLISDKSFSYEWEIKNEVKKINGISCQKAISNIKGNKVIAWFTKDIPVSYGPLNYWGLPGLIVQVENFFSTITLTSIKYSNDTLFFEEKFSKYEKEYNQRKNESEVKLPIFLIKKASLIEQLKSMM
ncbi:GLPGLI family protein [Riemerella columbina]|uniref:GLPGLI family protein n=1 Tax=Riemerella columbina TaxID=103810 RepID=UPI0003A22818|nr:GLPGLI family protein [Riemerella columbina]